jgi:hypothetical protein
VKLRTFALIGLSALCLTACSTTGQTVLNNVNQSCTRHYDGAISAGITGANFTGTFKADCTAAGSKPPVAAPAESPAG